jgi:hypothetical protein
MSSFVYVRRNPLLTAGFAVSFAVIIGGFLNKLEPLPERNAPLFPTVK